MRPYFKSGTYNAVCQVCGFTHKADELKKRWDGLMVCHADFEMRNPQDLIRVPKERPGIPWSSPDLVFLLNSADILTEDGFLLLTEDGNNLIW